jgi:hypothetical protein
MIGRANRNFCFDLGSDLSSFLLRSLLDCFNLADGLDAAADLRPVLLVAALLGAFMRGLQHLLPLGRGACVSIVFAIGTVIIPMSFTWGGYALVQQWDEFFQIVGRQLNALGDEVARLGVKTPGP